ncbi:MAG: translation elongation factor Ts [Actinobacteria bacterium]|jgi:elongation factor Ts|nr:translation elongation factor Ts [Actinomycetota bacterium]
MADINAKDVAALRKSTGAGMMDCKKALAEANGDLEAAKRLLREKGLADAAKKSARAATEGLVYAYMHRPQPDYPAKLGVMVELNCETDFVAKTEGFERLAKDIAMHISFADPDWTTRDQVPQNVLDEESAIYAKQAKDSGKPDSIIEKIVAGKLEGFYKERVLMDQEWIQDKSKSIADLINEAKATMGENITIGRFARIRVGEDS